MIYMRTDQPPFNDVRVRRAISQAIDRQALLRRSGTAAKPTPAIPPGLAEWSLPIDQLGAGAKYYQYDPQEARRLLAEAGLPNGFKTLLSATGGIGPDLLDAVQLVQRYLKDVGIAAELKLQEYGAFMATTNQGKFEGLAMGPSVPPGSRIGHPVRAVCRPDNIGHVQDPTLTAMITAQRRDQDRGRRKQLIFDIQRYAAAQQYYVYLLSPMLTASWQPYMQHYAPGLTFDYGGRAAGLWLDR